MATDMLLQIFLLLLGLAMLFGMHTVPKQILSKLQFRSKSTAQAKRHFVQGAQLLARARTSPNRNTSLTLSKQAVNEADKALAIDPKDAAAHILKALALDFQGHQTSALKSLDAALSNPAVKSLSERERGDSLFKRAELQMAVNRRRRVDSAIEDLVEAVRLSPDNFKAFRLLGQCYEQKDMKEEALQAYGEGKRVESTAVEAKRVSTS